ncbi:RHS repeat domain-containing protein [Flavobacterium davisii]|uniref:RHS repeat domain-containing protein n=1 Tax=Flavobacterium davisii TaxID=2906077 RepID=UPI002869A503|nr:RHS repeat-associated core domain-containing protein [Flavobacterium davisii]
MHEWTYSKGQEAETSVNELGEVYLSQKEAINDLVTWVYQENSFVPSAKIQGEEQFSIISDYIGRPVQCYSENGSLVWSTDYDIYGGLRELKGEKSFIPFRQLGQYEDLELEGLYYNRFRYYDCTIGNYISQDPLKYWGGLNLYSYVQDSNREVDIFGWEDIWFRALNSNDMSSLNSGGNIIPKDPTATRSAAISTIFLEKSVPYKVSG